MIPGRPAPSDWQTGQPGRGWLGYVFAAGSVAGATLLRAALTPVLSPTALPFITYFPAVAIAAWFGGARPATAAVALSALAADWWFIGPVGTLAIDSREGVAALAAFLLASAFIVAAVETLHRARRRVGEQAVSRLAAEAALVEARDLLSATLTSIGDGVIATDGAGRVTFLNPEAERLTGWPSAEAAGRPLSDVFRIVNEESRQPAENPADKALRLGHVVGLANHTLLLSRGGTEVPIDDSAAPIRSAGGEIAGVVLVFRDVSEARAADRARAWLAAIVEYSGDAVVTKDLNGVIQSWNRAAEQLFGYEAAEIIGRPITTLLPADRLHEETEILQRLRSGLPSIRLETQRLTKAGQSIPVSVRVSPIRDREGRVVGASKIVHDISDVIAAREALARETELVATTLASIGDCVIVTDAAGRVTFLNPAAAALTGWSAADAAGRELPKVFHIVNEETRAPVDNPVDKVLRDGVIVGLANHTVLIARDGTERPVDDSAAPIRLPTGELSGVVLVFRDVTARREADRRMGESERRFRTMADAAPVLIWVSGTDRRCTWFNKRWLEFVGRPLEQEVGDGWADNVHPDDMDRCLQIYGTHFDARAPFSMTYRLRRHDGEYRWLLDQGVPQYEPDGTFSGYIGSCIDVTEQRRAQEALQLADRRKDEFLAMLSHELRNPLAPISMAVAMMRGGGRPEIELHELRDVIDRQTAQLTRLLDDLLDVSRIGLGKISLRKDRVSLGMAVTSAIEAVRPLLESQRHELTVHGLSQAIEVEADLGRLSQVFANLLNNAAKYTEKGGHISVSIAREGPDAVVSVRDTGIGIAPDQLSQVFELFAQLDQSLERGHGGLGVGLSLARTLVALHGGQIEARSDGPGKGSEFIVRLPALAPAGEAVALAPVPRPETTTAAPLRILVADDNVDSTTLLATALRMAGHEVVSAHDGLAAVDAAAQFRPHVAILDIGMPKLNGYDAATRIRAGDAKPPVALIAMTGWGQEDDKRQAAEAGFHLHLTKPVDLPVLLRAVTELTAASRDTAS